MAHQQKEIVAVEYRSEDAEKRTERTQRGEWREREIKQKGETEAVTRGPRAHDGGSITKMAATEVAASTSRAATITSSQAFLEVEV